MSMTLRQAARSSLATGAACVVRQNVNPADGGFSGGGVLRSFPVGLVAALRKEPVTGHQRPGSALHFSDIRVPDRNACVRVMQTFDNRQTDPLRATRDHCHPLRDIMQCFVGDDCSPCQIVLW